MIDLSKIKKIHFIGIGGIGISAIARMMLLEGKEVSGSDRSPSLVTDELGKAGALVYVGHKAENIPTDADLIVYTNAMPQDNPEMVAARALGVPVLSYPEMLGIVSQGKYTIAVAGTHGKTTTTAMIAHIMRECGLDPTVIVGSLLKNDPSTSLGTGKTNFIAGASDYLVVEADEYRRSFLNLSPRLLVITNIDADHLDYYKDLADIQSAFRALAEKVPEDGFIVTDTRNSHIMPVIEGLSCRFIDYPSVDLGATKLMVPGKHNLANARAAVAATAALAVDPSEAARAVATFPGTWRRFEYKGAMPQGALVYDDYAHNPQKVRAALAGAREAHPDKKIVAAFQPHLYSRTKSLFDDFAQSFGDADEVIFLPIYAAREELDPTISSAMLARAIGERALTADSFQEAQALLTARDAADALIMLIGAGDITDLGDKIVASK